MDCFTVCFTSGGFCVAVEGLCLIIAFSSSSNYFISNSSANSILLTCTSSLGFCWLICLISLRSCSSC